MNPLQERFCRGTFTWVPHETLVPFLSRSVEFSTEGSEQPDNDLRVLLVHTNDQVRALRFQRTGDAALTVDHGCCVDPVFIGHRVPPKLPLLGYSRILSLRG